MFTSTITVTILDRPEGLLLALIFIAIIVVISLVSRMPAVVLDVISGLTFWTRSSVEQFLRVVVEGESCSK